ncbi:MAG: hypothetical protein M0Z28_29605 [Rhodospirillales bacterium]|nr:hypothetical protein [Rhodospirillales bacterium]
MHRSDAPEGAPGAGEAVPHGVRLVSTITCPVCGSAKAETMPTDACQFFYDCTVCGTVLRPQPGDCCVFCSYGDVPCPPVQMHGKACCGGATPA